MIAQEQTQKSPAENLIGHVKSRLDQIEGLFVGPKNWSTWVFSKLPARRASLLLRENPSCENRRLQSFGLERRPTYIRSRAVSWKDCLKNNSAYCRHNLKCAGRVLRTAKRDDKALRSFIRNLEMLLELENLIENG